MYGADFRPGIRCLTDKGQIDQLPPIAEYEAYIKSLPPKGRRRSSLSAARTRRLCLLYARQEPLQSIREVIGLPSRNMVLVRLRLIPKRLGGLAE